MKRIFTKTYITVTLLFLFNLNGFAINVTVMESQSFHPDHTMDVKWEKRAKALGHTVMIENYTFLDDPCNLEDTDILVISSALLSFTDAQKETVKKYVEYGGQVYIQAEYLFTHSGNKIFKALVTELGGAFKWEGQGAGQQVPMYVSGDLKNIYNTVNQLNYYWYGTFGSGDENVNAFLKHNGKDFGFIFDSPSNPQMGKIITVTDQDWIRNDSNIFLMENILKYLEEKASTLPLPEVSITSTAEESCAGEIVTFNADVLNYHPGVALQWMINGQMILGQTAAQFEASDLQDGDVVECVLHVDQLCGSYLHVSNPILMAIIIPISSPTVSITSNQTEFCENEIATFQATTSPLNGLQIDLQWLLNGQPILNANSTTLEINTLNNNDEINLVLSYSNACDGDIAISSQNIQVTIVDMVTPSINLLADQTAVCEGTPITFTVDGQNLGTNPTYQWMIDGLPYTFGTNELILSDLQDGQEVSVVVTSDLLCASIPQINALPIAVSISPNLVPDASITADHTTICEGEETRFSVISNNLGSNPNYEWSVDGLVSGNNAPEFISNSLTDGAMVRCVINLSGNCLSSNLLEPEAINMTVNQLTTPNIEINAEKDRACEGSSLIFTATGQHWGSTPVFQWTLNGQPLNDNNASIEISDYQNNDQLKVQLISSEVCATIDTLKEDAPSVEIKGIELEMISLGTEHCDREDGFIEVQAKGGFLPLSYKWSNGGDSEYLENLKAGDYQLTVTDDLGCTAVLENKVEEKAAPQILDIATTPALCEESTGSAQVYTEAEEDYTYHWLMPNGDIQSSEEAMTTLPAGLFGVEIEDAYGCLSTANFIVERHSPVEVDLGEDFKIRLGEEVQLNPSVNMSGTINYEWTISNQANPCTDCEALTVQPTENAIYSVVATNEFGCTATDEVEVKVLPNEEVFIPNAFSPDGDGTNDYFNVFGGGNLTKVISLRVFDRWGSVVFEKSNLSPNVHSEGWDGSFNGKRLDQGVYVYVFELEFLDGTSTLVSGDVSIF